MRRFWIRNREFVGEAAMLLGCMGAAEGSFWAMLLLLAGVWILIFRPIWLNGTKSAELWEGFPPERVDRPIPFTFRCSKMRFYSELSTEELGKTIDAEIEKANTGLREWHGETVKRKEQWKSAHREESWTLTLVSEEKGRERGAGATGALGAGWASISLFLGEHWFWSKRSGGTFQGKIKPLGNGSTVEGYFSCGSPLQVLWFPLLWAVIGIAFGVWASHWEVPPGVPLWMVIMGLHIFLNGLGRGESGNRELTGATEEALIDFFGEPELLE